MWGWNSVGRDCGGPYSLANRCVRTGSIVRCHTTSGCHHHYYNQRYVSTGRDNYTGSLAGSVSDTRVCPNAYSYAHAHSGSDVCAYRHAHSGLDIWSGPNAYVYRHCHSGPNRCPDCCASPKAHVHRHAHPGPNRHRDPQTPSNALTYTTKRRDSPHYRSALPSRA